MPSSIHSPINKNMNETPTPETDALYRDDHRPNLIEHARRLERERNEAREAAEHYRNLYYLPKDGLEAAKNHPLSWENAKAQEELAAVTAQRDEAREALKTGGMLNIIDRAAHERAAAIRERDEARAESIRWMAIAEGRGRTDDDEQCHTCGSTSTIDNGSACAQCGCDKSLTPNAKP